MSGMRFWNRFPDSRRTLKSVPKGRGFIDAYPTLDVLFALSFPSSCRTHSLTGYVSDPGRSLLPPILLEGLLRLYSIRPGLVCLETTGTSLKTEKINTTGVTPFFVGGHDDHPYICPGTNRLPFNRPISLRPLHVWETESLR